ncbi:MULTISPECIES: arginine repressor [unclassified Enterococcus]|uniref:arginine repressor n=1 Tax=unclassified Enterococcus TaxID=2608891 RepID=UPI0015561E40|nr:MULTISPECIES: arginine repressor [unclassified Enterococcus]MBS7575950.1 arginine repressor [Enterococcus sp. MMGLQ5-2]MBS7583183.1 arginine repressor [Enterococcus sp. MMGLQ5-1]NPD11043.1 arginine repressor [Enterococcus sp. MMGLQ5-1]NPD35786.1 arginine repressor [Enterococcus sp. MMGLQ5-2]
MKKNERQQVIKNIIQANKIGTQEELLSAIKKNGINATQATISRDIREIGIVKLREDNQTFYSLLKQESEQVGFELDAAYKTFVLSISQAEFVLVIKTAIGDANALASILDESEISGLVGTIAGADTILLITKNEQYASELKQIIEAQISLA